MDYKTQPAREFKHRTIKDVLDLLVPILHDDSLVIRESENQFFQFLELVKNFGINTDDVLAFQGYEGLQVRITKDLMEKISDEDLKNLFRFNKLHEIKDEDPEMVGGVLIDDESFKEAYESIPNNTVELLVFEWSVLHPSKHECDITGESQSPATYGI